MRKRMGKWGNIKRIATRWISVPLSHQFLSRFINYVIGLFLKEKTVVGERGLRTYFFENPAGIFFSLPLDISDKTKLHAWKSLKIALDPLEILRPKTKTLEIPHYFFLVTPGNSTSLLINPRKFHMLFLWYPRKSHILNPPSLLPLFFFSGIAQFQLLLYYL